MVAGVGLRKYDIVYILRSRPFFFADFMTYSLARWWQERKERHKRPAPITTVLILVASGILRATPASWHS